MGFACGKRMIPLTKLRCFLRALLGSTASERVPLSRDDDYLGLIVQ